MADTIPTKFTVPLVEYTRLASERGTLAARLAEAERLIRWIERWNGHKPMPEITAAVEGYLARATDSASVDYEQEELERMLKQEAKAYAAASADEAPRCFWCKQLLPCECGASREKQPVTVTALPQDAGNE